MQPGQCSNTAPHSGPHTWWNHKTPDRRGERLTCPGLYNIEHAATQVIAAYDAISGNRARDNFERLPQRVTKLWAAIEHLKTVIGQP